MVKLVSIAKVSMYRTVHTSVKLHVPASSVLVMGAYRKVRYLR